MLFLINAESETPVRLDTGKCLGSSTYIGGTYSGYVWAKVLVRLGRCGEYGYKIFSE
jgi:hypothetical protein